MSEEEGRGTVMFSYSHSNTVICLVTPIAIQSYVCVLHFIFAPLFIVVGNVGLQWLSVLV